MAITYECDRCGKATKKVYQIRRSNSHTEGWDLCDRCKVAFFRFMEGDDQVGDYIYKSKTLPCRHHVPCAGPCGETVYELVKR